MAPRISTSIWLCLGICLVFCCTATARQPPSRPSPVKLAAKACQEADFAHKRLDPLSLQNVLVWTQGRTVSDDRWEAPDITTPLQSSAQAVVIHLWAHWCEPCKADFHIYNTLYENLGRRQQNGRGGPVQFLYLAEDTTSVAMRRFLNETPGMPRIGAHYQDAGGQFSHAVAKLAACDFSLPLTLVLDPALQVHAAFLGSIEHRRDDLLEAIWHVQSLWPTRKFEEAKR